MKDCGKPAVAATIKTKLAYCADHLKEATHFGPMTPLRTELFQ